MLSARELLAIAKIEIAEVIERTANFHPPLLGGEQCLVAFTPRRIRE